MGYLLRVLVFVAIALGGASVFLGVGLLAAAIAAAVGEHGWIAALALPFAVGLLIAAAITDSDYPR